jgi:oligopeptide transport system ATP-binding protein
MSNSNAVDAPSQNTSGNDAPLLDVRDLRMHFPIHRGVVWQRQVGSVRAVDGVSFAIRRGETLGLVGESGCGKTTVGRCIVRLYQPTGGDVVFDGRDLTGMGGREIRRMRRRVQMIFQDPYSSLNPRMTVHDTLYEALDVHHLAVGREKRENRIEQLLKTVGLNPNFSDRYPHEFSGGQRQRIGFARALAVEPEFIVCDEPVSALDVSIQAQILNMLTRLQRQLGLTYLFIAHDLAVVRHISDRVAVMYLGRIVEIADRYTIYERPLHPYTRALLSAIPVPDPEVEQRRQRIVLTGDVPNPASPPNGCRFHPRCPWAEDACSKQEPALVKVGIEQGAEHVVACHLWREVLAGREPTGRETGPVGAS